MSLSCLMRDEHLVAQRAPDTERYILAQSDEVLLNKMRDRNWLCCSFALFNNNKIK